MAHSRRRARPWVAGYALTAVRDRGNQTWLLCLCAWLALIAQGTLAVRFAWHHHDDVPAGKADTCAVCASVSDHSQPIDPPQAVVILTFVGMAETAERARPAHLFALAALNSRGPPTTPVL